MANSYEEINTVNGVLKTSMENGHMVVRRFPPALRLTAELITGWQQEVYAAAGATALTDLGLESVGEVEG